MASKTATKLASTAEWPLLPPASHVFPTLQRFNISPRRIPSIPPGHKGFTPILMRSNSVKNLYHDLGVMVYAGSTVKQSRAIARQLKALNKNGATLPNLSTVQIAHMTISKYAKYRIPTEDRHFEQGAKAEHGLLSSGAVLELCSQAAGRWMDEAIASANKDFPNLHLKYFRESSIHINRGLFTRGIVHQTINGPRRLNVDAHVMIHKRNAGFSMAIELYAVGTGAFVGKMRVNLSAFGGENDQVFTEKETDMILDSVPSSELSTRSTIESFTNGLWALERSVWADRVDPNLYPQIPHVPEQKHDGRAPVDINTRVGPKNSSKGNSRGNSSGNSRGNSKSNSGGDSKSNSKSDLESDLKNDLKE